MISTTLSQVIFGMGVGRIVLGLAPFVAAKTTSRLLGFPEEHNTPTTRLMARFFGVRDIGLGVLVFYGLRHPETLAFLMLFNAGTDLGDLVSTMIPIVRRQGIDRAAWVSASFAFIACIGWSLVYTLVR